MSISRQPRPPPISGYQSFTSGGNASIGFERMMAQNQHQLAVSINNNNNNGTPTISNTTSSNNSSNANGGVSASSSGETIKPSKSSDFATKGHETYGSPASPIFDQPTSSSSLLPTLNSSPFNPSALAGRMNGSSANPSSSLLGGRGGSLKLKDSWRRFGDGHEHVVEDDAEGAENGEQGAGGLHRHTSLPGRSAPSAFSPREPKTTSVSRTESMRSSRHPSISEEGPPPNIGGLSSYDSSSTTNNGLPLGRSSSLKQVMEKKDWRTRAGVMTSGDDQEQSMPTGHQRSYSHSSTSPSLGSKVQDFGNDIQNTRISPSQHLFKSNSLRSTYSGAPGQARRGHAYTQSMYHLDSPPGSATSTSTVHPPGWDDLSPVSPTEAEAHSHLGHGPFPHQQYHGDGIGRGEAGDGSGSGMGEEGAAAMLRRHQSLQQGYGKSHRVADRLARSQAILAIENRTPLSPGSGSGSGTPMGTQQQDRNNQVPSRDVPPTSPIGRSAWSNAAVGYGGNDGWDELDQLKQRQAQGQSPGGSSLSNMAQQQALRGTGQPGSGLNDMDPVRRLRLLQAMEAMQLGSEMMAPPGSTSGLMASPANLTGLASTLEPQLVDAKDSYDQPRSYGSAAIAQGANGVALGPPVSMADLGGYDRQPGQISKDFYQHQDYASMTPQSQQGSISSQPGYSHMVYSNQPGYQVLPPTQGYNASPQYYGQNGMPMTGMTQSFQQNPNYYGLSAQSDPMQLQQMQRQMYGQPPHMLSPQITGPTRPSSGGHAYPKSAPVTGSQTAAPPVNIPPEIAEAAAREVREMVEKRGLNPPAFDSEIADARYFVIKSFTEDDVQKSLKHEIWSSTNFGNQRLDKAFNEARGPVYLFFSVNGSGHFCGMAQLLSGVNYNESSTVWAQNKWKGIMKLKWIFVKDIPNAVLRHIRLLNMPEQKPITNSRDTQELLRDAGIEVMRIMSTYREKTSLLHDYGYYEMQAAERAKQAVSQPDSQPDRNERPSHHAQSSSTSMGSTGPPPIIVPTIRPPSMAGFVKTFNPSGPPSVTNNKRFAVTSRGAPLAYGMNNANSNGPGSFSVVGGRTG